MRTTTVGNNEASIRAERVHDSVVSLRKKKETFWVRHDRHSPATWVAGRAASEAERASPNVVSHAIDATAREQDNTFLEEHRGKMETPALIKTTDTKGGL